MNTQVYSGGIEVVELEFDEEIEIKDVDSYPPEPDVS